MTRVTHIAVVLSLSTAFIFTVASSTSAAPMSGSASPALDRSVKAADDDVVLVGKRSRGRGAWSGKRSFKHRGGRKSFRSGGSWGKKHSFTYRDGRKGKSFRFGGSKGKRFKYSGPKHASKHFKRPKRYSKYKHRRKSIYLSPFFAAPFLGGYYGYPYYRSDDDSYYCYRECRYYHSAAYCRRYWYRYC